MSKRAEEKALEAYPVKDYNKEPNYIHSCDSKMLDEVYREVFIKGYEQAEKDIKEAIVKHFKYKQDHSPEHTLHWWVYKNVIDKVNEL